MQCREFPICCYTRPPPEKKSRTWNGWDIHTRVLHATHPPHPTQTIQNGAYRSRIPSLEAPMTRARACGARRARFRWFFGPVRRSRHPSPCGHLISILVRREPASTSRARASRASVLLSLSLKCGQFLSIYSCIVGCVILSLPAWCRFLSRYRLRLTSAVRSRGTSVASTRPTAHTPALCPRHTRHRHSARREHQPRETSAQILEPLAHPTIGPKHTHSAREKCRSPRPT